MIAPSRLLLSIACLAATSAVVAAENLPPVEGGAAAAEKPAALTFVGTIHAKSGAVIKVLKTVADEKTATPADKAPQPFEIGPKVKVTLDGKESTAKQLQPEMLVTITYDAKGPVSVDATSPAKKGKKAK